MKTLRPAATFAVLFLSLLMIAFLALACGSSSSSADSQPQPSPTRQPAPVPSRIVTSPPNPPASNAYLNCPECKREGMPANIFKDESLSALACRTNWGTKVRILDQTDKLFEVDTGMCSGWVSKRLVVKTVPPTMTPSLSSTTAVTPTQTTLPLALLLPTRTPTPVETLASEDPTADTLTATTEATPTSETQRTSDSGVELAAMPAPSQTPPPRMTVTGDSSSAYVSAYLIAFESARDSLNQQMGQVSNLLNQTSADPTLLVSPSWKADVQIEIDLTRAVMQRIRNMPVPSVLQAVQEEYFLGLEDQDTSYDYLERGLETLDSGDFTLCAEYTQKAMLHVLTNATLLEEFGASQP